jgi:hypothetical protein
MKQTHAVLTLFVFAACLFGCVSDPRTPETGPLPGLENPSVQIMTSLTEKAPVVGSFGWGYCLFKVPQELGVDISAVDERLREALSLELSRKGLVFAESDPDVLVSYALAAAGEINDDELNQTYGDLLDAPAGGKEAGLYYKRGVLILDLVDRKSKHLLWRGAIMAGIDMSWPEERKQERCDAAINALLSYYPHP